MHYRNCLKDLFDYVFGNFKVSNPKSMVDEPFNEILGHELKKMVREGIDVCSDSDVKTDIKYLFIEIGLQFMRKVYNKKSITELQGMHYQLDEILRRQLESEPEE